jgi:hypothetical protein
MEKGGGFPRPLFKIVELHFDNPKNREIWAWLKTQRADYRYEQVSEKIFPTGYRRDFLYRLRSATRDDNWHFREVKGGALALCQYDKTMPRKFAVWYCGRTHVFSECGAALIRKALVNHWENIGLWTAEEAKTDAALEESYRRDDDDASTQIIKTADKYINKETRHFQVN